MLPEKVLNSLEEYYLSCNANPPPEVADYSSDLPKPTVLQPGEAVQLPAPSQAPKA